MKRLLLVLVAAVGTVAVTAPAFADEALAKAKKCGTCHAVDKTKMGPSYQAIAKKYAGQKDASGKLVGVILKGQGDMPASANVNDAEAKQLADWILATK